MLLVIDLDGVVADFSTACRDWVSQEFGYPDVEHDAWDFFEKYPDAKMVKRAFWNKGVTDDHVFLNCDLIPGAHETLWQLWEDGHSIVFATHRRKNVADDTRDWLDGNDLPWAVHHLQDKWTLDGDFYLDDKPENVADIRENGGDAYLFAQPWNTEAQDELPTVRSWREVDWLLSSEFVGEFH